jgi:hypothetical protein
MSSNTYLLAFGTFGNPNGFKQTFFIGEKALSVKTFDLNTNAIKLFPNCKLYSIRKEIASGFNVIAYTIYSYAKEQNSDRSGTFIGSSVLYTNKICDEQITFKLLNEFHENLTSKNVQNNVITVNHSDKLSVDKPSDFDKIESHLRYVNDLNFTTQSNKNLVVYCKVTPDRLKIAIDLLNVFDTIYFTSDLDIADFVSQKGILRVVNFDGFEQEVKNLQEERKRRTESAMLWFEDEKQRIDSDKKRIINDLKEQIEQNEKRHEENEKKIQESKNEIKKVEKIYEEFSLKIKEYVNQLKSGKKLDDVKQIYNENKRLFVDGVNQIQLPSPINTLAKINGKSNLQIAHQHLHSSTKRENKNRNNEETDEFSEKDSIDYSKVMSLVLIILLSVAVVFLCWIHYYPKQDITQTEDQIQDNALQPEPIPIQSVHTDIVELNPKPNDQLNEVDYRFVAKNLKYGTRINEVVKVIFDKNPTDIKSTYATQDSIYAQQIVNLNKNSFEARDGTFYFIKDTLKNIPSYKKQ